MIMWVLFSRDLRQQVQDLHIEGVDLGPDESQLQLTDQELVTKQQKTMARLQEDLHQTQGELEALRLRVRSTMSLKTATSI